jgi:hypothetical protein
MLNQGLHVKLHIPHVNMLSPSLKVQNGVSKWWEKDSI